MKAKPIKPLPERARLLTLFDYDPETGDLRWRLRPADQFRTPNAFAMWNKRYAGKPIRSADADGYLRVTIDYKRFQAHRVIFKILHDQEPAQIDHEDTVKSNNRPRNLRPSDQFTNQYNTSAHKDGTSGFKGVSFLKSKGKFRAIISCRGRRYFLGYSETAIGAAALYEASARRFHGEFARVK
jgi:hypothetical protein